MEHDVRSGTRPDRRTNKREDLHRQIEELKERAIRNRLRKEGDSNAIAGSN